MIKQFVPSDVCLRCLGCCRFEEQDSAWVPCLLEEEMQFLLDKDIPPACISLQRKLLAEPHAQGSGYLCPFLDAESNRCKVYGFRPFECQLYPFLLVMRNKRALLTVDLNCPYAKEKLNSQEFKEYTAYLESFLNSPAQLRILKDNPQLLAAYEEVLELLELTPFDEAA